MLERMVEHVSLRRNAGAANKLTYSEEGAVVWDYANSRLTTRQIADKYGIAPRTVYAIIHRHNAFVALEEARQCPESE